MLKKISIDLQEPVGGEMVWQNLMVMFILACLLSLDFVSPKSHTHPIPTYFHRHNADGSLTDRSDPSYNAVFDAKFLETISPLDASTSILTVHPNNDVENGEEVTVTWKNIIKPSAKDWIGLYCPHNDTATQALDYFYVTDAHEKETWKKGFGDRAIRLYNMRNHCEMRYYRNVDGGDYAALVTKSELIRFKGGADLPMHGHLSLTNDPSQMRVMWISGNGKTLRVRVEFHNKVPL